MGIKEHVDAKLNNMKMRSKLLGSFLLIIMLLIVIAGSGYINLKNTNDGMTSMYNDRTVPLGQLGIANGKFYQLRGDAYKIILLPGEVPSTIKGIQDDISVVEKEMDAYRATYLIDEEKSNLSKFDAAWAEYKKQIEKVNQSVAANDMETAKTLMASGGAASDARKETDTALQNLIHINIRVAEDLSTQGDETFNTAAITTVVIVVISIVIALILSMVLTGNISRRFSQLLKGMEEVKSGVLSYRVQMTGTDEFSQAGNTFDSMAGHLENQTLEIQQNLERSNRANADIMTVARDIRGGNLDTNIQTGSYEGEHLTLVEGVNDILSAFIIPLREVKRMAKNFGDCNFATQFSEDIEALGEFEELKCALNNTKVCLADAITAINEQVGDLAANAEEANASTEEVAASAKTLADSASMVSKNAEKGTYGVTQILKTMEDLTTTVNQVATRTDQVSKLTNEADSLSKEGASLAGVAEKGMQSITISTEESRKIIDDITSQMEEIGKIVTLIRDISDQTSLLALNAAIEAARAGDAGLGFAVVADEVKTLAQETQKSAENIAGIIATLQKRSVQAADAMEKTSVEVVAGGKALGDTLHSFTQIVELIDDINRNVSDVAAASEEQAASVEEIMASIHEVGSLVGETSKEAELSALSTNEASEAVNQISGIINNLNEIVERVQKQINLFKI